jgi:hypothetical protein
MKSPAHKEPDFLLMSTKARYQELLDQKKSIERKLKQAKKNLDHPHGQWQSAHDLAESQFHVYSAHLESIEKELEKLKKGSAQESES